MLSFDMRSPVLDWELPPVVATPDEIDLANELLHRLEARYLGAQGVTDEPSSAPG